MNVSQKLYKNGALIAERGNFTGVADNVLVLAFGGKDALLNEDVYGKLRSVYLNSNIVVCSTAGEIYDDAVSDQTVSVVALEFEHTKVKTQCYHIGDFQNSYEVGKELFADLDAPGLTYILLISDGGLVNGSQLVEGIGEVNIKKVPVTGGLAGDGDKFNSTLAGLNAAPTQGNVIAVGFYGSNLKVGHSSFGGWEIFGPERLVTKSAENILYEIDGKNALGLYKQYLGKYADNLPGSALLFPLCVRPDGTDNTVVRTILSIDNKSQSMVFAGDIPQGSHVRFMKANFDRLIDAATSAATNAVNQFPPIVGRSPQFALLISCVGRKLILGSRTEEEVEAIKEVFGSRTMLSGFYSYGEISPLHPGSQCQLHNQTMTITTFTEESN